MPSSKLSGTPLYVGILIFMGISCSAPSEKEEKEPRTSDRSEQEQKEGNGPERETRASHRKAQLAELGVNADAGVPKGLKTGDEAPAFEAESDRGEAVALSSLLKEGPVVLFFYRGQWCPVCNRYLSGIRDSLDLIREKGASVVAVTPETAENVTQTREKTETDVTIIPDADQRIMEKYDVAYKVTRSYQKRIRKGLNADIAANNGDEEARLPVPATYVIAPSGKIAWRQFDLNYKNRASIKAVLKALNGL